MFKCTAVRILHEKQVGITAGLNRCFPTILLFPAFFLEFHPPEPLPQHVYN